MQVIRHQVEHILPCHPLPKLLWRDSVEQRQPNRERLAREPFQFFSAGSMSLLSSHAASNNRPITAGDFSPNLLNCSAVTG